jgi:hypothetical protein
VTFEQAVQSTPEISRGFCEGLQGVKGEHRGKIVKSPQCSWRGSVDLESALAPRYPNDPQWDYAVGFGYSYKPDRVAYVEVHPATSTHIGNMIRKKEWLIAWLNRSAPALRSLATGGYHWVSTDGVHIQSNSPQHRRLAQCGISIGRVAKIG